ncbi:hypothetical protein K227x_28970 [Rubripirellula lacrimiformis]|uniref:Uncharacterized protein n=1 Tax=Rubripirellula lacrimiformis TaxID=1930273 RepID=A0A517NBJ0_9BACT|nr:hypothetical protein K227x_28970 [Rubripirellula lacrimiformis]
MQWDEHKQQTSCGSSDSPMPLALANGLFQWTALHSSLSDRREPRRSEKDQ